jgi:hypothetical protein
VGGIAIEPATWLERFNRDGVCGPVKVLSQAECQKVLLHETHEKKLPMDWWKGRAASDPFYASMGTDERILALLRPLLGSDIILWGVDILTRAPGEVHPWHCDIESSEGVGGFASVWIGLQNTSRQSTLNCIVGSHMIGRTVQEEAHRRGLKRGEVGDHVVLDWVKSLNPEARHLTPDISDGDALVFDGRLWHGTHNEERTRTRTALLLQYASAERPVRMIDLDHLEWPFHFRSEPRPPVLVVSGKGNAVVNRIVSPPSAKQLE